MSFTPDELKRYSPHFMLEQVGFAGQLKLKSARVLCIGAGGLGSPLLLYLTAAGVGTIGIVDDDNVELSNLQRQILYQETHLGHQKALIAKQQLMAVNSNTHITIYPERFNASNAESIASQYDIIADCSDNFLTRYLVNDTAFSLNKPYVFASVTQFTGQCATFLGHQSACFRCLFPVAPPTDIAPPCTSNGILGVLPGLLGTLQATEILKWVLGFGNNLSGSLLTIDLLTMKFETLRFQRNTECVLCTQQKVTL
ncbi:MAG: moeZ 3 [Gammaproteobacteria bacterium]|jgi:adenylyltransferase/sulfurtransferase|nr:moeZ 3 [Gammaproteobacteria bacterium]